MLGGDSGRFLCFCLRRSLSFRLWGRRGDQILVLRAFGVNINVDTFIWGVDSSQRQVLWPSSPLWRDWGTGAGQEWLRQVPLRASSPSPSPSLPAKNSLSHYHTSDTEHHTREPAPAGMSTQDTQLCGMTGAGHTVTCGMRGRRHTRLQTMLTQG